MKGTGTLAEIVDKLATPGQKSGVLDTLDGAADPWTRLSDDLRHPAFPWLCPLFWADHG